MNRLQRLWIVGGIVTVAIIVIPIILVIGDSTETEASPWDHVPAERQHVDHTSLIQGPFETGSDVTRECLTCHEESGHQMMNNVHWTWLGEPAEMEGHDELVSIGKANTVNNFCIGIQSNWSYCTRCHAGYGWEDENFDFTNEENVDCLVCHDQSGSYVKTIAGEVAEEVDLVAVAQSVGSPTRANCGGCHFNGGGGNGVKHGDLDSSLYFPPESVDVHMGRYDFQCIDCHRTEDHQIAGRSISVSVDNANQISCLDCHDDQTHDDDRLNAHIDTVACQTCHIPSGALRDPTKMEWDWSQAGDLEREDDPHVYLQIKGSFVYEYEFTPYYIWYNGLADRQLIGDIIDPSEPSPINEPHGDIDDPNARIWPFKIHFARQPYDAEYNYLIPPHTAGEGGYWTEFDWDSALRTGAEAVGLPYSGNYDFAETLMYWPVTHMVQPAENALQCTDCHGEDSRMPWEELGYFGDPMIWGGRN